MLNQLSCLIIILTQSYLLKWNSFSSSTTCLLLNVILGRLRLESGIKEQSLLASDMISSSSSRSSADFPELEFGEQVEDVPWLAPESGDLTCRFICIQGNILYIFAMLGLAADELYPGQSSQLLDACQELAETARLGIFGSSKQVGCSCHSFC